MKLNDAKVFIIIGPSAVGKSTIVRHILKSTDKLRLIPTWTDRPKRKEEDEIEHIFVSNLDFTKKISEGYFLEIAQPFNLPYRYGMPKIKYSKNRTPLLMLRAEFVPLLKKYFSNTIIYQIEAPKDFAKNNLSLRDEQIGNRLTDFKKEIKLGRNYANKIFYNNSMVKEKDLVQEMLTTILRELTST